MTCGTCGQAPWSPKKRIVKGNIVEQCVDKIHDEHVEGNPSNAAEFLRQAKKAFRQSGAIRSDSRVAK